MQAIAQHRKKRKRILLILILLLIGMTPSNAQIEGLLNGTFSINEQVQVGFSKGNLQYQASTNTWRFAEEQTDYIGAANSNISSTNSGWIDLFGWGTSGFNHGSVCYQPWSTNQNNANYYAYGNGVNSLFSQTGQADWGYNAISNGGNQIGQWRTLTMENWYYLLYTRSTPSGIRYTYATIDSVKGLILFPDDWNNSIYTFSSSYWDFDTWFEANTITLSDWKDVIEPAGAVFLPAASYRAGTTYYDYEYGNYWTSSTSSNGAEYAASMGFESWFDPFMFYPWDYYGSNKSNGLSVRLAKTVQFTSYTITTEVDPVDGGTVTGEGDYEYGQYCTLTASPNDGYSFCSWKEDGAIVSLEPSYGFTVTENRNLVADFNECGQKCNVIFNLNDSYGDGWNDANLIINFDGTPYRTLTLDYSNGYSGTFSVPMITGAHVSLEWISGYYDNECSFTVNYESGIPIFQMSSPSAGLLYEFDCNCGELFNITTVSNPLGGGGTLTGAGYYGSGEVCTLTAVANDVHVFENWTKDGVVVSDNPTYSFTVTGDATYVANFTWTNPFSVDYVSDGLIMYVDGIYNKRSGHTSTTNTWEDLMGNYDLAVSSYSSYTWEDNHFFSVGNGGYLNTGKAWKFFHSFNNDLTIEIVAYIDCDRTSPSYRGLAGWHEWSDGTNFQNDQGSGRMQTLGGMPVTEADNMIATVSYTKYNGSFLNGIWKKETNGVPNGANSDRTVVFGNSHTSGRSWNDSIYCIRMYSRSLTPEEVAYNHSIDVERFHAGTHFGIYEISVIANPTEGGTVSGAGTYETGQTCTLTAIPNNGYVFDKWYKDGIVVSNNPTYSFTVTGNGVYSAKFMRELPELHVTSIAHSDLIAGQQVTVSWTVQNDGIATTPNGALWHDRVWLSTESRVAADDNNPILLGTFDNLSALNPGEYYTQTQTFTLPLELSGTYYLFVLTDAYDCHTIYWGPEGVPLPYSPPPYIGCLSHHCSGDCANVADNRIYEQSEYDYGEAPGGYYNDNFFYTLVNIAVPPLPDLQVSGVIPPDNFFSGTHVAVTAYITNTGDHVTYSDHWADALFIASEPDINSPTAVCLDVKQHSTALGAGQTYQVTLSGQVPVTMYGEAYFFVYTDCYDQVYEHVMNHNNTTMSNAVNIILTPPADLVPTIVAVSSAVSTAENLTYSFRVNNIGAGSPNVGNWVDKVYLSLNPDVLDDNAILLKTHSHHGKTVPGAYYTVNETVSLPSEVVSGSYYLYVHTDANNEVFEYLYDDNNLTRSSVIEVSQPDLQVTQINAPEQITSGYPMSLSYTLSNSGNGIVNNRNVTDRICISVSGNMTDTIGLASIKRSVYLQPSQSLTVMCNNLAPYNLNDGTFYLIVLTDYKHEINESDENNNSLSHYPMSVMHQPLPDLEPISLVLPEVVQAGENVSVQFDVINNGDMDLLNSNCTFDVYAVVGEEEILCPLQSQTLPLGNTVSIGINETTHFVRTILVPPTVTSACTTFNLIVDKENQVLELDTLNNVFTTYASVLDCPLPDLVVTIDALPELQSGDEAQVSFSVSNVGTADFEGTFNTAVYVRSATDTILCPLIQQTNPVESNYTIPTGGSMAFSQQVLVPPMVNAFYYLMEIVVDENNAVLEANDNNNATTATAMVNDYPFDLKAMTLQAPESVWAAEATTLSWSVKNIGTCPSDEIPLYVNMNGSYRLVEGETLPVVWVDKVFVSDDPVWDEDDPEVYAAARSTVLHPNTTYTVEHNVTLPYTHLGSQYLICVSDATRVTYDSDTTNNVKTLPVEIQLGELPDLRITSLTVDTMMHVDNAYWVRYTVTNEGERVTQTDTWTDALYVSENDFMFGALQLGNKIHHGALNVGESYTDSIEILIPNGLEGDYYLLGFTDKTNQIFEHENEDNNLLPLSVTIMAPAPCDLIAVQPDFPTSMVSGGEMSISWQLRNIGSNPATGRIRNAVYLSADAEWSNDDKMLGYADMNINITANGEQSCQLSGSITGFDEGSYYVIVKANILNALNESTYENNVCVSMLTTEITFPTLAIGETIHRTILPERNIYYKIEVGAEYEGQALLCRIASLDNNLDVSNGLYISHGSVPTTIDFDYGVFVPYSHEQEILIPSLEQGTYYLMAQGAAFEIGHWGSTVITRNLVPVQNISISASIVNFEILSVNANHGSNMGSVTTKVTGAKFEDVMDIRLVQGDEYLPAQKVYVNNSSEAYVTFDLTEMPLGTYDVEAELPGGVITVKEDAFTVEEGVPSELMLRLLVPASVRNGNTFPITLEYGNTGYTDLNVIGFKVVSRNGHPIGTTAEELQEGKTERVVYVNDNVHYLNGMNPGFLNNKVLIMKATPASNIKLSVFAIRRQ